MSLEPNTTELNKFQQYLNLNSNLWSDSDRLKEFDVESTNNNLWLTHTNFKNLSNSVQFNYENAYNHIHFIALQPHSVNSYGLSQVKAYLKDYINLLSSEASNLELDFEGNEITTSFKSILSLDNSSYVTYLESENLLVRIKGKDSTKALLLSSHYDSTPLSYGANDAGITVAINLELLRSLVYQSKVAPLPYDIIINFNTHEEVGLLGSLAFMRHPWAKQVQTFINMDSGGAGGKALLFQTSHPNILNLLEGMDWPHVSVLGNDMFRMNLVKSSTDFIVYSDLYNLKGFDIVLYNNRAFYHTLNDNSTNLYMNTIQHMSGMVTKLVSNLIVKGLDANTNNNFKKPNNRNKDGKAAQPNQVGVYYDVFKYFTFQYSFDFDLALGLGLVTFGLILIYTTLKQLNGTVFDFSLVRTFLVSLAGIYGLFKAVDYFIFNVVEYNIYIVQRSPFLLYVTFSIFTLFTFSLKGWLLNVRVRQANFYHTFKRYSLVPVLLFLVLLIGEMFVVTKDLGILYFVKWLFLAQLVALSLPLLFLSDNQDSKGVATSGQVFTMLLAGFITVVFANLMLHDIYLSTVNSFSQNIPTGTNPKLVYLLIFSLTLLSDLPLLPYILILPRRSNKKLVLLLGLTSALLAGVVLKLSPLDGRFPVAYFWTQTIDLNSNTNYATLHGISDIEKVYKLIRPITQLDGNGEDEPVNVEIGKRYNTIKYSAIPPKFPVAYQQLVKTEVIKLNRNDKVKQFQVTIDPYHSKNCALHFKRNPNILKFELVKNNRTFNLLYSTDSEPVNSSVTQDSSKFNNHVIQLYRRKFVDEKFNLNIDYFVDDQLMDGLNLDVVCYYDQFRNFIPALSKLITFNGEFLKEEGFTITTLKKILEVKKSISI